MNSKDIQIDFEVWKELVKRMASFDDTPNDVLRQILGLPKSEAQLTNLTIGSRINKPRVNVSKRFGYKLIGEERFFNNAKSVLISALEDISKRQPNFLEDFIALPKHGRSRRYVARTSEELYAGREDLAEDYSVKLGGGYWVGTNYSRTQIRQILKLACEVAGYKWGEDFIVYLGD